MLCVEENQTGVEIIFYISRHYNISCAGYMRYLDAFSVDSLPIWKVVNISYSYIVFVSRKIRQTFRPSLVVDLEMLVRSAE